MTEDDTIRKQAYAAAAASIGKAITALEGVARWVESEAGSRYVEEIIAALIRERVRVELLVPREPGPLDIPATLKPSAKLPTWNDHLRQPMTLDGSLPRELET